MGSAPSQLGISVFSESQKQLEPLMFKQLNIFSMESMELYQGYEVTNNYNQQSKWKLWSSRKDLAYNLNYVEAFVTNFDECQKPITLKYLNILSISMAGFQWMVRWSSVQSIMTLIKCTTSWSRRRGSNPGCYILRNFQFTLAGNVASLMEIEKT